MSDENGQAPSNGQNERWPRFGDQPHQVLHPDVADQLLRLLIEREPATFARLHVEVLTGEKFTVSRRRAET